MKNHHIYNDTNITIMSTKQIRFALDTKPENYGPMKKAKPIKRNLEKRKAYNGSMWYYRAMNQVQGPHDGETMRLWHEGDYFGPTLDVRMGNEGEFAELEAHFPDIREAFCVPSQLCTYLLSNGENVFHLVNGTKRTPFTPDDFVDELLCVGHESDTKVWMGDYYVGTPDEIYETMMQWKLASFNDYIDQIEK